MKDLFENIKDNLICRRKRSLMMRTYLSGKYFMFDSDNHISFCPKCQIAGKRYKAFREELESEINKEVEVPNDFASKVIDSLDKKIKTTTNKGTKIILLSLIGLIYYFTIPFYLSKISKFKNSYSYKSKS